MNSSLNYLKEGISLILTNMTIGQKLTQEEISDLLQKKKGLSLKPSDYKKILNQAVSQNLLTLTEDGKYQKN